MSVSWIFISPFCFPAFVKEFAGGSVAIRQSGGEQDRCLSAFVGRFISALRRHVSPTIPRAATVHQYARIAFLHSYIAHTYTYNLYQFNGKIQRRTSSSTNYTHQAISQLLDENAIATKYIHTYIHTYQNKLLMKELYRQISRHHSRQGNHSELARPVAGVGPAALTVRAPLNISYKLVHQIADIRYA